ncbi:MAG: EAL domain-containing protein [Hasllibacter sp.]
MPGLRELLDAASADALRHHVQPIWDVPSGRIAGAELLLRWPRDGVERPVPQDLISEAVRRGGLALGLAVGRAAEAAALVAALPPGPFVSLNVADAFLEADPPRGTGWTGPFAGRVPPGRLVFEIVETAEIRDPERTRRLLERLRGAGYRVALDDFGAGRSDLERLGRLPLDMVKLDRALVAGAAAGAAGPLSLLREAVGMAMGRGIAVIAEGIETADQREAMLAEGIRLQQGFLMGRPAPPEAWADRLGAGG